MIFIQALRKNDINPNGGKQVEFGKAFFETFNWEANTVHEIIKAVTTTKTASRIIFEILESEGIENYEEVSDFIIQMKALGAKVAIDDFGTGYSNFEHILKLNIDYIKIDGSLIKGIGNS